MTTLLLLFAMTITPKHLPVASVADTSLAQELTELIEAFDGKAGIYARHLASGYEFSLHADTIFPTASMIKVPILAALMQRVEDGELDYHAELVYRDSLFYPGTDILGAFKDGEKITLDKVAMLMITTSDNTAALWCQSLAGSGTAINHWLADNGFEHTRVNSRTEGRRVDWERYGWGQTTPREMARLLTMIRDGKAVSLAASNEMYRVLSRIYFDDEALSRFPPAVQTISKQGAVSASRSEVVLVNAPHGDFVFSVITDEQTDTSWEYENEGYVLIRNIASALWRFFEPDHPWELPVGWERYAQ